MFRIGIEFLALLPAIIGCVFVYRCLVKSRGFGRVVRDLTDTPAEAEIALERVDAALEMAEHAADDLEQAEHQRSVTLKELRRKTRL